MSDRRFLSKTGKPSSPAKLAHIVLRTRDKFEAMRDWYKTVLCADVIHDTGYMCFLTYDDEHHRIALVQDPSLAERPHRCAGLDHVAFTYSGLDELLDTYTRLAEAGIVPFCPINHGPTTSLYYQDPDGNRVELQVDNFDDMADATQLMRDTFEVNSLGIEIDPDELVRRRHAGESVASLLAPPAKPEPPKMEIFARILSS